MVLQIQTRQESEKRKRTARRREAGEDREELGIIGLPVKAERQKRERESHGELGREGEFTKAAQEGPHYDIKQDLISESDLMR